MGNSRTIKRSIARNPERVWVAKQTAAKQEEDRLNSLKSKNNVESKEISKDSL